MIPPNRPNTSLDASSDWHALLSELRDGWRPTRWLKSDIGVVLACSGGADSVAMVRLFAALWRVERDANPVVRQGPLVIAHFNHRLRGDESDHDERFVVDLATSLGLACETGSEQPPGDEATIEISRDEATLRQRRRGWLVDVAARLGCRVIAVAHTLDDQAETVLHQLLRGTGAAGLAGMSAVSPLEDLGDERPAAMDLMLHRPLLSVRRQRLRDVLREHDWAWREDHSNADHQYTRNWIRLNLLPLIATRFPDAVDAIGRAASLQQQQVELTQRFADDWLSQHAVVKRSPQARFTADRVVAKPREPEGSVSLAHHPAVLVAACQTAWDRLGWPRGAMTQRHWSSLSNWLSRRDARVMATRRGGGEPIADNAVADQERVEHLPGRVRCVITPQTIECTRDA